MFDSNSRYYNLETADYIAADGRKISYIRRRFLPQGKTMPLAQEVTFVEGDRLDLIAYKTLGDSEEFWQICDANNTMNPTELTSEIGETIRIPIPQV
ncbi:LysM domain-containing protein [Capilliphycus salinus ALCB114379]|uniref:LysM domain-containing protein n=1 Tax=Capilliphycus salinus TaxID=2768948 RepID=UPI0039A42FC9